MSSSYLPTVKSEILTSERAFDLKNHCSVTLKAKKRWIPTTAKSISRKYENVKSEKAKLRCINTGNNCIKIQRRNLFTKKLQTKNSCKIKKVVFFTRGNSKNCTYSGIQWNILNQWKKVWKDRKKTQRGSQITNYIHMLYTNYKK